MSLKNILNANKLAKEVLELRSERDKLSIELDISKSEYKKLKKSITPSMKEAIMLKEIIAEMRLEADTLRDEIEVSRKELSKINKAINSKKKYQNRGYNKNHNKKSSSEQVKA
jgi:uncharacterized coiled-coil DUF342 family protein